MLAKARLSFQIFKKLLPSCKLDTVHSTVTWENYFHWVFDGLTRLEGVEYYQKQTGHRPKLIIPSNPLPFMVESLKLMGYDRDDCIEWNMQRAQVQRLIVSPVRYEWVSMFSPAACRWLRNKVLSNLPDIRNKRLSHSQYIYISRRKARCRRVINEDDVMEVLGPMGFIAYTLEDMTFSEQVKLFSKAKIIVGPQGSGMTNMVWAQNASVIEFRAGNAADIWLDLAKANGLPCEYLECESKGVSMVVNIGELCAHMQKFRLS